MTFWQTVKRGFGYGLGGSIGWNLGNLIWRWIVRLVGLIGLALAGAVGVPFLSDSVGAYQDYVKTHPVQKPQQHHEERE